MTSKISFHSDSRAKSLFVYSDGLSILNLKPCFADGDTDSSNFVRTLLIRTRCAYIPFSIPENGMTSWRNSVLTPLVPNVSPQNFDCCSRSLSWAWKKWKVPTSHWLCSEAPGFTVLPEEPGAVGGWHAQPGWARREAGAAGHHGLLPAVARLASLFHSRH